MVGQEDSPIRAHQDVPAQLVRIPLDRLEPAASHEEPEILPEHLEAPDPQDAPSQAVYPIDGQLPIEEERQGHPCLPEPLPGLFLAPRRDKQYLAVQPLKVLLTLAQLRHVLPSEQSAKVAQENEKDVASAELGQRDGPPVHGAEGKGRSLVARLNHGRFLLSSK